MKHPSGKEIKLLLDPPTDSNVPYSITLVAYLTVTLVPYLRSLLLLLHIMRALDELLDERILGGLVQGGWWWW